MPGFNASLACSTEDMTSELWNLPSDAEMLVESVDVFGKRVVDVGCGGGGLVRHLRAAGAAPLGIEVTDVRLEGARTAEPDHAADYRLGEGQLLPLDDASADVIVFMYSLHHVPIELQPAALVEAVRVLKPGGVLAVCEPVLEGPGEEAFLSMLDETEVRAAAQAALDGRPAELTETDDFRYETNFSYADAAEVEADLVGVDPSRADRWATVGPPLIEALFGAGVEHDGRHYWQQSVRARIFTSTHTAGSSTPDQGGELQRSDAYPD